MNWHGRKRDRGSIIAALMILVIFIVIVMGLVLSIGQLAAVNGEVNRERDWEVATAAWRGAVGADVTAELRANSYTFRTEADVLRRKTRIAAILQPSGSGATAGVTVSTFNVGALSADSWSKLCVPTLLTTMGLFHPLGKAPLYQTTQAVTGTLEPNSVHGKRAVSNTLLFGTWAASDVGLVLLDAYSGISGPVLTVSGTALLPGGFTATTGTTRLTADTVTAPAGTLGSGVAGKTLSGTRVAVHPYYAIGWGAAPATLCAPYNQQGTVMSQSFFDRATVTLNVMNGVITNTLPAGVSIAEYPTGSGVLRVKLDLAVLGPNGTNVYVNFLAGGDISNGIAVLGASSAVAGQHVVIATNGAVRLCGNNVMPVTVASAYGQVFCDDLTAGTALAQSWVGSLYFPVATAYSTGQAAAGATLTIQGSLVTGTPSGVLPRITIVETQNGTVRGDGPRFTMLQAIR